jgi:hypothetical protein
MMDNADLRFCHQKRISGALAQFANSGASKRGIIHVYVYNRPMSARESVPGRSTFVQQARADLPNLFSLLAFLLITAGLFRSWEFALIVTASLGVHELGHGLVLAHFRLDWRISFGLVGAWTWSLAAQRRRLSHLANSAIHLAGPAANLLMAFTALALHRTLMPQEDHLPLLASFNAHVAFLNLLPFGSLTDGGKVVRRLMISQRGRRRAWGLLLPLLLTLLALAIYILGELPGATGTDPAPVLLSLLLVGAWLTGSMLVERRMGPPVWHEFAAPQPLTQRQSAWLLLVLWNLLSLSMLLIARMPFWLAPKYLLGTYQNLVDLLKLLVRPFF